MRWPWVLGAAAVAALSVFACEQPRDLASWPGPPSGPDGGDGFDAGLSDGPPPLDAPGLCGNELHETGYQAPNLYFVFDRSGSMSEPEPPSDDTRYEIVRDAALDLVRTLGPLINVGAALLPQGNLLHDVCSTGDEVFETSPGDPVGEVDGETTAGFAWATNVSPQGGTPVAATLEALVPILAGLPGQTLVLLATDGAPNCNPDTTCGIDECIAAIEDLCPDGDNCCEPGGWAGPQSCIDRAPTVAAIEAIHGLGVDVYVIGIPGSATYADVLDEMAVAGGTARNTEPRYHRVDDLTLLSQVFAEIAADAISCEFALTDPPDDRERTNVYLNGTLIPYDPVDGWTWETDDTIVLHGEACQLLKSGAATTVQIVTGCPTEYPR